MIRTDNGRLDLKNLLSPDINMYLVMSALHSVLQPITLSEQSESQPEPPLQFHQTYADLVESNVKSAVTDLHPALVYHNQLLQHELSEYLDYTGFEMARIY